MGDWERKEIVAEVVALATKAMFRNHFYQFGGDTFHQRQGGPIGLRGTCAIARVVMNLFDRKWKLRLQELGIKTWLMMRYIDDSRTALPPLRAGWRWDQGSIRYSKVWEEEDELSGEIRTKNIMKETMKGIEEYLEFTVESGEEFEGGG